MINKQTYLKSFSKKAFLFIPVVLILIAIACWLGRNLIIRYYHYSKIHHFTEGDKVYMRKKMFSDTSFKAVSLYRLIRPIHIDDIDRLNVNEAKKDLLKQDLADFSKLEIISIDKALIIDSLRKRKSNYIGTFIRKEFIKTTTRKNENLTLLVYAIKMPSNFIADNYYSREKLPINYNYADSNLYLMYWDTSDK